MADVNFKASLALDRASGTAAPGVPPSHVELIELLFFAYRDFVGDPDVVLETYGFGRAHHRVLHFVDRNPGISVTDLLDILKITKQSLGRVLKQLVDSGFIEQRTGPRDRRQRLLFATPKGCDLASRLTEPQTRRIAAAIRGLGPQGEEIVKRFLSDMINAEDRAGVARLTTRRPD
ncbi:MAG: MarR family transcriptional regulator [Hyphomicrobiales bacterium]